MAIRLNFAFAGGESLEVTLEGIFAATGVIADQLVLDMNTPKKSEKLVSILIDPHAQMPQWEEKTEEPHAQA